MISLLWSVFRWQFFITYIFSVSLKFQACYFMGQWGEFTVKNTTLYLNILSLHFFFVFHQKKLCFYRFHFFFWWNTKFLQQNINQPETGIGDKKLPVELYVCLKFKCVNHSGDLSKKRKIYCFDIDKPFMLYMLSTVSLIFSVLAIQIQFIALWLAYQVISVMI